VDDDPFGERFAASPFGGTGAAAAAALSWDRALRCGPADTRGPRRLGLIRPARILIALREMGPFVHLLTGAAVVFVAGDALACSEGLGIVEGLPEDGETDVPTDVVPWFTTNVPGDSDTLTRSIRLETDTGDLVDVDVRALSSPRGRETLEVAPREPLRPQTLHRIVLIFDFAPVDEPWPIDPEPEERSLEFTTGPGAAHPSSPEPPGVRAVLVHDEESPCGGPVWLCLGSATGESLQVALHDTDGVLGAATLGRDGQRVEVPWRAGHPFCMEAQARTVTGQLSSVETICSEDMVFLHLPNDRDDECVDGTIAEEAATPLGCAGGAPLWLAALRRRRQKDSSTRRGPPRARRGPAQTVVPKPS
jgi:hypothetical protein